MKKIVAILALVVVGYSANAQSPTNEIQQALVNGCNDGTNARGKQPFGNAYYSIMNNGSISAEYKDAYNEAYTRCFGGGKYYWKKDVLVYEPPKDIKDSSIKPGIYTFKTYLGALKKQ
ncbi:hypothetical protein SAMN04490243_2493 [Robiginitalea myxolifaciens]|uniref:Uncharacterized protein n=1 Tax=Robiginitalea myxolifaciens TaxID=400055 RepID=A0A1I6HAY0_9FLAO|nr:hypothetical protein [Robiginitalea myxolifaciens]SFR51568.1 hypothetical protein SAMN04490243_2493 [Robiginitalea myxolifaciens]